MTDKDAIIELENPPDVIRFYPRFADACAQGAAALRRDGDRRDGDLAAMYKQHLDRVLDAYGASSVDELVAKADGGKKYGGKK